MRARIDTMAPRHNADRNRIGRSPATSTVGRGKSVVLAAAPRVLEYSDELVTLQFGDAIDWYDRWPTPTAIISDGAYGVLGFEGDTSDHLGVPDWYEAHVAAWAAAATPRPKSSQSWSGRATSGGPPARRPRTASTSQTRAVPS
jgi:hypothetical protein